jgi:hypothetical protein
MARSLEKRVARLEAKESSGVAFLDMMNGYPEMSVEEAQQQYLRDNPYAKVRLWIIFRYMKPSNPMVRAGEGDMELTSLSSSSR